MLGPRGPGLNDGDIVGVVQLPGLMLLGLVSSSSLPSSLELWWRLSSHPCRRMWWAYVSPFPISMGCVLVIGDPHGRLALVEVYRS